MSQDSSTSERGDGSIIVSKRAKVALLSPFRALQRFQVRQHEGELHADFEARVEVEWDSKVGVFSQEVMDLAMQFAKKGKTAEASVANVAAWYSKVMAYFEDNWFCDEWRSELMGIPEWSYLKAVLS